MNPITNMTMTKGILLMKTNKLIRAVTLLLVAMTMLTCVAYANDLLGIVDKGKTYLSQLFAAIAIVAVLYGVMKLVAKQNYMTAGITFVLGCVLTYFIAKPEAISGIIDATIGKIV